MKSMSFRAKLSLLGAFGFSLIAYQNCGDSGYMAQVSGKGGLEFEDLTYMGSTDLSNPDALEQPQYVSSDGASAGSDASATGGALDFASTVGKPTRYNFVAGSKETCEESVMSYMGENLSCYVGGGCGVTCGLPNSEAGSECVSANPTLYGLCLQTDPQGEITAVTVPEQIPNVDALSPTVEESTLCEALGFPIDYAAASVDHFVEKAYCEVLHRESETEGHEYWRDRHIAGDQSKRRSALTHIVMSIESHQKNELANKGTSEFITFLYRTLLGREPESGAVAHWVGTANRLDNNRYAILEAFLGSTEPSKRWGLRDTSSDPTPGMGGGSSGGNTGIQ